MQSIPRTASPAIPASPGGPASPSSGSPLGAPGEAGGPFASAVSKQLSESSGADPEYVKSVLKNMQMQLAQLMPHVALRVSGVDKHLTVAYRAVGSALEAAEKFATQIGAAQGPINFSAASTGNMSPPAASPSPSMM